MGGVEPDFQSLQPVAFLNVTAEQALVFRQQCPFELGEFRHEPGWPHIAPDESRALHTGIRLDAYFVLKTASWRLIG